MPKQSLLRACLVGRWHLVCSEWLHGAQAGGAREEEGREGEGGGGGVELECRKRELECAAPRQLPSAAPRQLHSLHSEGTDAE